MHVTYSRRGRQQRCDMLEAKVRLLAHSRAFYRTVTPWGLDTSVGVQLQLPGCVNMMIEESNFGGESASLLSKTIWVHSTHLRTFLTGNMCYPQIFAYRRAEALMTTRKGR